jgi:hypothetical protein
MGGRLDWKALGDELDLIWISVFQGWLVGTLTAGYQWDAATSLCLTNLLPPL